MENRLELVRAPGWERYGWLQHGFSTRAGGRSEAYSGNCRGADGGELNLGYTAEDDRDRVAENRRLVLAAVAGQAGARLVTVRQVHGSTLRVVRGAEVEVVDADGQITDVPGMMLAAMAADCVPVLVADPRLRVVGAFHAGWRGTAAKIVEQGVALMAREYGSRAEDLIAAVGPAIGACCYTVGEEVRRSFEEGFEYAGELFREGNDGGLRLDLAEANRRQLSAAGLRAESVTVLGECTACARIEGRRKYFSHRAEKGVTGRGMGIIGIAAAQA